MGYTVTIYSALIIVHRYPANTPLLVQYCPNNVSRLRFTFEQKTCIYTIFNWLKEFAQRANAPNFVGSRRLVRPKPELFLSAEQIRSLAEVPDAVSGPTQLFLLDVVTDPIRILKFH